MPFCTLYFLVFDLSIFTTLSRLFANFSRRFPKGIDNPFYTLGCEYLLFVCRCYLRSVAWFSYWFDNLGLITEGNTYRSCAASSLPLWGNTDVVRAASLLIRCMEEKNKIDDVSRLFSKLKIQGF